MSRLYVASLSLLVVAAAAASSAQVIYGNSNQRTSVTGSDNAFFEVRGYTIDRGRLFSRAELQSGGAACVIGATVRNNLFQARDPIGATPPRAAPGEQGSETAAPPPSDRWWSGRARSGASPWACAPEGA